MPVSITTAFIGLYCTEHKLQFGLVRLGARRVVWPRQVGEKVSRSALAVAERSNLDAMLRRPVCSFRSNDENPP